MPDRLPFDLLDSPLSGRNLLEASAGTGKTFTIAALFLRLLLEADLMVDQILVVTYTEAATEELRERIRGRLRSALEALDAEEDPDEDFLRELLARFSGRENRERARRRLSEALVCFDEAAIHTIHGFCQRVLQERAFEAGSLFDTELVTSQVEMVREVAEDFWRVHVSGVSPEFAAFAAERKLTPERLTGCLGQALGDPEMTVLPLPAPDDFEASGLLRELRRARCQASRLWQEDGEEIRKLLLEDPSLNRNSYRRESLPAWFETLEIYFGHPTLFTPPEKLEKFTTSALEAGTRKGCAPPRHPFFELSEDFLAALREAEANFERGLVGLQADFIRFARRELPERKRARNIRYFDDLLLEVRKRIDSPAGPGLVEALRRQFRAAFIDEFQDTDPVQFAIFQALYPDASRPVFYIGDPKQAIYSFRGADIFAYLEAARTVDRRYTLGFNWRSTPDLVAALNKLFSSRSSPFVFPEITFIPAAPSPKEKRKGLERLAGEPRAPLRFWLAASRDPSGVDNKGESSQRLAEAVAAEAGRLLRLGAEGAAVVERRRLLPEDLAVLVRTHREGALIESSLARRGIPSVQYGTGSLFDSREAREILLVLRALADPGNEFLVRAALGTSLFGRSGEDIGRMVDDDRLMEAELDLFGAYHDLWRERGVMALTGRLLGHGRVRERLLAMPGGERALTNLLHGFELLHRAAQEQQLGVEGLLKWYARQFEEGRDREEHQIRLETDERAVKIVTIHKSKGLEYGVVFCPFCWNPSTVREGFALTLHDPVTGRRIHDLGSEAAEWHREIAQRERLAESLRLLYVALTRAKYRCYVAWGPFKEAETSSLAYLLHGPGTACWEEPAKAEGEEAGRISLSLPGLRDDLEALVSDSSGTITVDPLPGAAQESKPGDFAEPAPELVPPVFRGRISRHWRSSSFSSLVAGGHVKEEGQVREPLVIREEKDDREIHAPPGPYRSFLEFPRGARAGSCLHAILEEVDFTRPVDAACESLIRGKLQLYGFETGWTPTLLDLLRQLLRTPLETPDGNVLRLDSLEEDARVVEMEFYLPMGMLRPEGLAAAFKDLPGHSGAFHRRLADLGFLPHRGMVRGFIDLVFRHGDRYYLLDWKSNHLGNRPEDYGPEGLGRAMEANFYVLQYHLYLAALDRFLAARLPDYDYDKHVGGVLYLFLRGMVFAEPCGCGVFVDRPGRRQVAKLLDQLRCGEADR